MKIVRSKDIVYAPASHENPNDPGALKKVLFSNHDLLDGTIQMINWSLLPCGKSFQLHYHECMEEVFIILSGRVEVSVNNQKDIIEKGDAIVIPSGSKHTMNNISDRDVEYIAIGITKEKGGKTIVVQQ